MAVVGTILLNSVFVFYTDNFVAEINDCFDPQMQERLKTALGGEDYVVQINDTKSANCLFLQSLFDIILWTNP